MTSDIYNKFDILVANIAHVGFAEQICFAMEESAKARGTGIAKRSSDYLVSKMLEGKAIIAFERATGQWAGFCYIETWAHDSYVANSGLIVTQEFRRDGLAKQIKKHIFELSRQKYPDSKIFGITTSLAVMKINSELGYEPVTFSELPHDEQFWKGCQSCVNYDILSRTNRKMCLCTGMLYDPAEKNLSQPSNSQNTEEQSANQLSLHKRLLAVRQRWFAGQTKFGKNSKKIAILPILVYLAKYWF